MVRWIFCLIQTVAALAGAATAQAERYLTLAEVKELCFPEADHFELQRRPISSEQAVEIAQRSGARTRHREFEFWIARRGSAVLGVLMTDQVLGKHDLIDYAAALTPEGTVLQVEIMEYRERYGAEIRSAKWRRQFVGKSAGSGLKLNDDIYNISGATISCSQVSRGLKRLLATYDLLGRSLVAGVRLPDSSSRTAR